MKGCKMCIVPEQFLCTHSFLYCDYEYFAWFGGNPEGIEDRFVAIFRWKGLHRAYNPYDVWGDWNNWDENTINGYSLVTRVFLNHLREPIKFPILDKNVWVAAKQLKPDISSRKNYIEEDYEAYRSFFNELYRNNKDNINCPAVQNISKKIVKRRVLDRVLWEYGRILLADNLARNAQ
ncbi:MAG: hypothetical protein WC476_05055 [Phycisphaerae bacterium]|jgi:hypothetical protein